MHKRLLFLFKEVDLQLTFEVSERTVLGRQAAGNGVNTEHPTKGEKDP